MPANRSVAASDEKKANQLQQQLCAALCLHVERELERTLDQGERTLLLTACRTDRSVTLQLSGREAWVEISNPQLGRIQVVRHHAKKVVDTQSFEVNNGEVS